MLIREGNERNQSIDLRLAGLLSLVAGALNAAGFELAGLFSANMTGNISAMADNLAKGGWGAALLFGLVVVVFILGALVAGLLIEAGRQRGKRRIYAAVVAMEAVILILTGLAALAGLTGGDGVGIICMLAGVLGMQNAVSTRISRARVRTTHVSGMATDVGLSLAGLCMRSDESARYRSLLALHCTTISAFLVGGVLGVVLHRLAGPVTFLCCGLLLALIALPEMLRR
ncbi:MAG: DUF1275 domain-containing protein [Shimia sp.]|uniref:YoaK family protein n=1 Tax=Salipiger bermudensis TaxID=344736 RepID=UPI001CD57471|nr:YoaK family protein [Salipiger bermudensis]MBR9894755.1 DUF1275 domain-containing protein [bacterium]MCA1285276.1 DUF1275 domain-containing protein [Salipiger bermudensis]MCP4206427.1 DUF1275 domain-containing protein [Shimia sp.]